MKKNDRKRDDESPRDDARGREPQSYGSQADWVTGKTDQTVDSTPSRTSRHDEAFYEDRHDASRELATGGMPPPNFESQAHPETPEGSSEAPTKVTGDLGGRESYFKKRDYEEE